MAWRGGRAGAHRNWRATRGYEGRSATARTGSYNPALPAMQAGGIHVCRELPAEFVDAPLEAAELECIPHGDEGRDHATHRRAQHEKVVHAIVSPRVTNPWPYGRGS